MRAEAESVTTPLLLTLVSTMNNNASNEALLSLLICPVFPLLNRKKYLPLKKIITGTVQMTRFSFRHGNANDYGITML
ncbi:MAG: hypothetical protein NTV89_04385 [Proteobacteria bacterium]|nr:hypothetical protein [Pseudomonadota bacterium]